MKGGSGGVMSTGPVDSYPRVSIIMPVFNEESHLERTLCSVLKQDYPADRFEIIVADGMSTDRTREIVLSFRSQPPNVRLVTNPGRIVSTGLNTAIHHASGEIIIRMDAHTEYAADYVRACVAVLQQTGADNVGGPARTKAETYMQRAIAAAYHSAFAVGGGRFHDVDYEGYADTVTYGCWRKEAFERFGLYDEELVRNQDDEHNLRILRSGGRVWQSPRIRSWYHPRDSLLALFKQYMQYGYWKVRVIQKHKLPASWRHVVPGALVMALMVLALGALVSVLARWLLLALLTLYGCCVILASTLTALRAEKKLFFVLPLVFGCFHFGYGWGFTRGLEDSVFRQRKAHARFERLTR